MCKHNFQNERSKEESRNENLRQIIPQTFR